MEFSEYSQIMSLWSTGDSTIDINLMPVFNIIMLMIIQYAAHKHTHPWRLPLQDVEGSGRVDGQLEPYGVCEQQTVQHTDAFQGAPLRMCSPLAHRLGLREVIHWVCLHLW